MLVLSRRYSSTDSMMVNSLLGDLSVKVSAVQLPGAMRLRSAPALSSVLMQAKSILCEATWIGLSS